MFLNVNMNEIIKKTMFLQNWRQTFSGNSQIISLVDNKHATN